MLNYNVLKNKGREFLAATGLKREECEKLLPAFRVAYEKKYSSDRTQAGKARQRRAGGGAKGRLPSFEEKLLFILVYQKTHPLQTMHGLHFKLSQAQTHDWIHRLLPVLQLALRDLGQAPERSAARVEGSEGAREGGPNFAIDGIDPLSD